MNTGITRNRVPFNTVRTGSINLKGLSAEWNVVVLKNEDLLEMVDGKSWKQRRSKIKKQISH
ncbi:hypothetical protein, partial [Candidatus Villigracilis saccharophilus]|uniref:hypothetical protein n=1 Tax=Candidatus Villigracilis saccharophilus TaxID=3140684 RepID=UPI0031ED4DE9